jgi:hypothetical protein
MQENDRVPITNGDVTHLAVKDVYATTGMVIFGRDPVRHGMVPSRDRRRPGKAARN